MHIGRGDGYSLWLVPEPYEEPYNTLIWLIGQLSIVYQTPVFVPHVTLLSDIPLPEAEIWEKTEALTRQFRPYEIQLGEIGSNRIYFQTLFASVHPTDPVVSTHDLAERVFPARREPYFPHLSFAYGDLTEEQVATLEAQVRHKVPNLAELGFLAERIQLWRTIGTVSEWRHVATFPKTGW